MKKRVFVIVSLLLMAVIMLNTSQAKDTSITGKATANGFGGADAITVTIKIDEGKIKEVTAEGPKETQGIGSVALEKLPAEMIEKNAINVDVMTGATISSTGILKAAEAALTAAGVNPEDYKIKASAEKVAEEKVFETDIAIVGAGGAGMIAAITAADAGKKVILIEKQAMVGGNSVRATGGMNAAHTPEQAGNKFNEAAGVEKTLKTAADKWSSHKVISDLAAKVKEQYEAWKADGEKGYFDSSELMQLDTLIGGHGINDPVLLKALCDNTADAIAWLKTVNIDLSSVGAAGGASVKRIHRPVDENKKVLSVGATMIPKLEAACKARKNITLMTETMVKSILTDDKGNVCGVMADSKGNKVTVKSKAVILATGGFGANLKMVAMLNPALDGFMTTNAPGATGEGIIMAQELGAAVVDMKQIQIHPTVQFDSSNLITEGLRGDGAILVNTEGKRFIDEVLTRDVVSKAEIEQPNSFAWLIIDQKMVDDSSVIKGYIAKGYTFKGDTYEDLAAAINLPADIFANTVKTWNGYVKERNDPDFGRTSFIEPLDKAPFYAIKVTPGIHHTMGGLKIDGAGHVLRGNGKMIPGLFAAGEVTGGVHGGNRLGGTAVADFVVYGRIAGKSAAEF
ncbi:MAG: flavocytochrome c [Synergistaceae bacterium]|nr:flavocytochrome c [Synergistaceae bacterium]